jgi:hypothetical protein
MKQGWTHLSLRSLANSSKFISIMIITTGMVHFNPGELPLRGNPQPNITETSPKFSI